jgi:hypothetical protein
MKKARDMTDEERQVAMRKITAYLGSIWRDEWSPQKVHRRDRPRCGAKTRSDAPCRAPCVWDRENDRPRNGRCKLHGGLSPGPATGDDSKEDA